MSVPEEENSPFPKTVFYAAIAAVIIIIAISGTFYYRGNILPEKLFQSAERSFEDGDYKAALESYGKVLDLKPGRRDTLFKMGYSMEMRGDETGAMDAYVSHLRNEPDDKDALFRLGTLYFNHDMYREARDPLLKAKAQGAPVSADYMLGVVSEALGDPAAAHENFVEAIRRGGGDAELLYSSSRALMRLGYYSDALEGFTEMGKNIASGDMRAFHASNAAKSMLGWPTDPALVIEPGSAIGSVAIGSTSSDLMADSNWGAPKGKVSEGELSVWGYGGKAEAPETLIYMENDAVIEIATSAKSFRTKDGLGIANFMEPKYAGRFEKWMTRMEDATTLYRYILKGGGLAFFVAGDSSSLVVYSGDMPLSKLDGNEWKKIE
jgi:tetratricopeptide (TPR) repeat protein